MLSSNSHWLRCAIPVFIASYVSLGGSVQVSRANTECTKHLSATGIDSGDVSIDGGNVTFKYYVKKDDLLSPENDLYTLHWDEGIVPLYKTQDLRFSKFFDVNERNQSLKITLKKSSLVKRTFSRKLRAVESRRVFGVSLDSANCTVVLRHYFFCLSEKSNPASLQGNFVLKGNATEACNTTEWTRPASDGRPRSSDQPIQEVLLNFSEHTDDSTTSAPITTTEGGGDVDDSLQITVGIVGGVLALVFFVGIGIGLYYNYKRGVRLGFFQQRPKEVKTISTLGSIYPNIGMSASEIREKVQDPEDPATISPYPNYAYANPAATEPVPVNHRLI
ncbi:uncharacterized protein LOC135206247 [Macrobrachium nipponense]|uniref:uncharacterized protein LOC135206247 n=1 Tax=Macrobrachium nipponense TaxID=159736 RepID=UPI0030C889E1